MKTKEQIYVHIKNEETRKKAVEVLKRHNQSISYQNQKLSDYNENEYLKFDKYALWWVTSDYKTNLQHVTVERLDEILSKCELEKSQDDEFLLTTSDGFKVKEGVKLSWVIYNKYRYDLPLVPAHKTLIKAPQSPYKVFFRIENAKHHELEYLAIKQPEPTINEYFGSIKDLPLPDFLLFKQSNKLGYIDQLYDEKPSPRSVEKSILQEAEEIINGSRAEDYGSVTENFTKIAVGWKEIFADGNFTPRRVALAMAWLKICRDVNTPKHDNILDLAGYAGCVGKMDNEAK